jgi:hypothetical protein
VERADICLLARLGLWKISEKPQNFRVFSIITDNYATLLRWRTFSVSVRPSF